MIVLGRIVTALAAAVCCGSHGVSAFPTPAEMDLDFFESEASNNTGPFAEYPAILKSRQTSKDVELRIMALGASIMEGVGSTHHSGNRKWIKHALRYDGYQVNMVGTRQHGTDLKDNDHEATSGAKLHEVLNNYLPRSLPYKPNIVYINIGTNNANSGQDVATAYDWMGSIVDRIWNYGGMSETCVIVSTLLPTNHGTGRINRIAMNQAYRNVVRDKAIAGKCIYLADMEPPGEGSGFLGLNQPVWAAGENPVIHPNDEGHKRMAYIFYAAMQRALRAGKVKKASDMEQSGSANCDKKAGGGEFSPNTQRGSGEGNGIYQHFSAEQGVIFEVESPWDRNQWRWARLFDRKYDDLLGWYDYEPNDHRFGVWKNSGDGKGSFSRIADLHGNIFCIPRGLRFADVDGDGLDDIVCISPTGDLHISRNMGNGNRGSSRLPTFEYLGKIMTGKAEQKNIRLADIDGDGRVDYGVVRDNGAVEFWRNGGTGKTPDFWQHLGIRSTMTPGPPSVSRNEGIRFEDINGDGRDDFMWLTNYNGETTTYTNSRSCKKGREGDGLHVAWRQAFFRGKTSGWTHGGISHIKRDEELEGDNNVRDRIHFARIYGREESFAFKDQSVKDYVFMEVAKGDDKKFKFKVHAWKNMGSGGTKLEADGNRYCNMHGWADGRADYVWIWSTGEMDLYPSRGVTQVGSGSFWGMWEPKFWKPPHDINRRDLHLADFNGDGACDIIWTDPSRNNRVTVWINNYPTTKRWSFTRVQRDDLECNDRSGIGIHDNAVQFAYLGNDNRRADYLCIRENGLVRGRRQLNNGDFGPMVQFKKAEGVDRANIRWGDVNGDGRDDLIWVDKFNGNARVWYGGGPHGNPSANGGSSWQWRKVDEPVYSGSYAGTCQYFPDLNGNGRADLHSIMGTWTNNAETWFNKDCALRDARGDDSGMDRDPNLPVQEGNPIGGDGPGDGGTSTCDRYSDDRDWRKFKCDDPLLNSHSQDSDIIAAWRGIDVIGGWRSALDWWHCRRAVDDVSGFSSVISDFFHGPQGFRCERFTDSGNCGGGNPFLCDQLRLGPAGYFILNSFRNIASINRDWDSALSSLSDYTEPDDVASDFGMKASDKDPKLAILLDVFVMGYSIVMGPIWNKVVTRSSRPGLGGGNAATIKDEINDFVKNSATLGKDIYAATHKALTDNGTKMLVAKAIKEIVTTWRENTQRMTEKLFDGSDASNLKLTLLMDNAAMLTEDALDGIDPISMTTTLKRALHAQMIPITWSVSAENMYPVIIREELGCNGSPSIDWTNNRVNWMTSNAFRKRICIEDVSYWLVAPQNYQNCKTTAEGDVLSCPAYDLPPGYEHLENNKYNVNTRDVVEGSINTWVRNGRSNGGPVPDVNTESVDAMIQKDLRAPGFFRIPVCDMSEVRDNWEKAYNGASPWANFPCDE